VRTRNRLLVTTAVIWCGAAGLIAVVAQPLVTPTRSSPPTVDPARLEAHV
jgi:hypothetical protein